MDPVKYFVNPYTERVERRADELHPTHPLICTNHVQHDVNKLLKRLHTRRLMIDAMEKNICIRSGYAKQSFCIRSPVNKTDTITTQQQPVRQASQNKTHAENYASQLITSNTLKSILGHNIICRSKTTFGGTKYPLKTRCNDNSGKYIDGLNLPLVKKLWESDHGVSYRSNEEISESDARTDKLREISRNNATNESCYRENFPQFPCLNDIRTNVATDNHVKLMAGRLVMCSSSEFDTLNRPFVPIPHLNESRPRTEMYRKRGMTQWWDEIYKNVNARPEYTLDYVHMQTMETEG